MPARLANITFDCADPMATARFWSAVLDRPVEDGASPFFVALRGEPSWLFINVPEAKSAKNRTHVDLVAGDREKEVERLVALGATRLADHDEWGHRWTVLQDPDGHEFCVAADAPELRDRPAAP